MNYKGLMNYKIISFIFMRTYRVENPPPIVPYENSPIYFESLLDLISTVRDYIAFRQAILWFMYMNIYSISALPFASVSDVIFGS